VVSKHSGKQILEGIKDSQLVHANHRELHTTTLSIHTLSSSLSIIMPLRSLLPSTAFLDHRTTSFLVTKDRDDRDRVDRRYYPFTYYLEDEGLWKAVSDFRNSTIRDIFNAEDIHPSYPEPPSPSPYPPQSANLYHRICSMDLTKSSGQLLFLEDVTLFLLTNPSHFAVVQTMLREHINSTVPQPPQAADNDLTGGGGLESDVDDSTVLSPLRPLRLPGLSEDLSRQAPSAAGAITDSFNSDVFGPSRIYNTPLNKVAKLVSLFHDYF
jgi:hypothetical protein